MSTLTIDREQLKTRLKAALEKTPRRMTSQLARDLDVPEAEILRTMADQVTELDAARWEELIRAFEPLGMLHVICNSSCVTLEAFGQFSHFSTFGEYFNVQNKSLDMHIRHAQLKQIFAVEKPSHMDGQPTLSIQFYDADGNSAFKVFFNFGGKAEPQRIAAFNELREKFAIAS